ncbi:11740_t:CDS:2 [Entrophospora sp. SA101]|nr:11740_t:CDS:2 [Entrophospora sp. SA101]
MISRKQHSQDSGSESRSCEDPTCQINKREQAYVALLRAKSLASLKDLNFTRNKVMVDPNVKIDYETDGDNEIYNEGGNENSDQSNYEFICTVPNCGKSFQHSRVHDKKIDYEYPGCTKAPYQKVNETTVKKQY